MIEFIPPYTGDYKFIFISSTYNILLHRLLLPIKNMPISGLNIVYVTFFLSYGNFSSKFFWSESFIFFKSTYYTEMQEESKKNTSLSFCFDKIHIYKEETTHNTHGLWHLIFKELTFVDTIFWSMVISPKNDNVYLLLETAKSWTCK